MKIFQKDQVTKHVAEKNAYTLTLKAWTEVTKNKTTNAN